MCTLILGWGVVGDDTLLLAANRDESPARPSARPRVLRRSPRIVGGRDLTAGGTWLALRGDRCAVAILNRRPHPESAAHPAHGTAANRKPPSRGLLALSVAAAGDGAPAACAAAARLLLAADTYAPCSIVIAGMDGAFVVHHRARGRSSVTALTPGWHVITHEDMDDVREPRTAWLAGELRGFRPQSADEGLARLGELLARHEGSAPAVCLHEGRMVTVSTAHVAMTPGAIRYSHGEGPACRAERVDYSHLLADS